MLYAKTMPFYLRDLSIHGVWYPHEVLEQRTCGYWGMIVLNALYWIGYKRDKKLRKFNGCNHSKRVISTVL